jgi:hypothetical protein
MARLLEEFVPADLPFAVAVEAGDVRRALACLAEDPALRGVAVPFRTRHMRGEAPPLVAAAAYGYAALVEAFLDDDESDPFVLACAGCCGRAADRLLAAVAARPDALGERCPAGHAMLGGLRVRGASLLELALAMGHGGLAERLVAAGHAHSTATAVQMGDAAWLVANRGAWEQRADAPFRSSVAPARVAPDGSDCCNRWARIGTYTLLIAAVRRRDAAVVRALLAGSPGPDVFAERGGYRSTAINFAQVSGVGER